MDVHICIISRPQVSIDMILAFLNSHGLSWQRSEGATPAEELVEVAGRICYLSFGDRQATLSNEQFIRKLIRNEHESVLEHVSWTFLVAGISRALTHQLVRHRIGFSFSQLSQQYHDERAAEFIEPSILKDLPHLRVVWEKAVSSARDTYRQIMEGVVKYTQESCGPGGRDKAEQLARSAARSVLPNATETKLLVTANARALRHFFTIRGSTANDPEMRCFSVALFEIIARESPKLFSDFVTRPLPDGSQEVIKVDAL